MSRKGACRNDDPPRPVTCLHCLGRSAFDRVLGAMMARGVTFDQEKLEEARKLWAMETIPMGPGR